MRSSEYITAICCRCADALERYGRPEIFNTDHGGQLTSLQFPSLLNESGVAASMDDRGRCMDDIFIERLWRSTIHGALTLPWGAPPLTRPMTVECQQGPESIPLPLSRRQGNFKMG